MLIYFEDILILSKVILMQEKLIVDRLDQEILKTFNKDYFTQLKHARNYLQNTKNLLLMQYYIHSLYTV